MKKILFVLFVLAMLLPVIANAGLGIKKASEFIAIPLLDPLGSDGLKDIPDSAHIVTYADNGSAAAFTTRSTTYPFSAIGIDTIKIYGDTLYFLVDQIQDIDGTAGNFELAITVTLWAGGIPTRTYATVQVVNDSLNSALDNARVAPTAAVIGDTIAKMALGADTTSGFSNLADYIVKGNDTARLAKPRDMWINIPAADRDSSAMVDTLQSLARAAAGVFDSTHFDDSTFALDLFATNFWTGNIGTNYGDITNVTTAQSFTNTMIGMMAPYSIVLNGGFELGATTHWSLDSGTAGTVTTGQGYGLYHLITNASDAIYTQNVTLDSGWYALRWIVDNGVSSSTRIWVYDSLQADTSVNVIVSVGGGPPLPHDQPRTKIFKADSSGAYEVGFRLIGTNARIDEISIMPLTSPSIGASVDLADVWRNQDTANVDSSGLGVWMVNNLVGAGASLDTTQIKTMLTNNSFAQTGTSQIWNLRGLHVRGTTSGDTAAIFQGKGVGHGFYASNDSTGHGMMLVGGDDGTVPGNLTMSHGLHVTSPTTVGFFVNGLNDGAWWQAPGAGADGFVVAGGRYGAWFQGSSSHDIAVGTGTPLALEASIDTQLTTTHGAGSWVGGGDGNDTMWVIVMDSVAVPDSAIATGANVTIENASTGADVDRWTLSGDGSHLTTLISGNSYKVQAVNPYGGWVIGDTTFTAAQNDTVYVRAYEIPAATSAIAKTCAVTVNMIGDDGQALEGVWVTASLARLNVVDSAGNVVGSGSQRAKTDVNGQATFTCIWSSYLVPNTDWVFSASGPTIGRWRRTITVPRQASYTITE